MGYGESILTETYPEPVELEYDSKINVLLGLMKVARKASSNPE
jgi:hypothetical protein